MTGMNSQPDDEDWGPDPPGAAWWDSCATLHLWTQVVGKVRLALAPPVNHWWQVALYVTPRGLTTSAIPHGRRSFSMDFDFIDHQLVIAVSDGSGDRLTLEPRSVADFHAELMGRLRGLDLPVRVWTMPVEIADPVPFEHDTRPRVYDPIAVERLWRLLVRVDRVIKVFRGRFIGKASPVHFFWGSFDLTASRFSGRRAPPHATVPNTADRVTREAYSHEVSSCGFWPGGPGFERPTVYAYAYPQPPGFDSARVRPASAFYSQAFGEYLLPCDSLRGADAPERLLLDFLQDTYAAAADGGAWDRAALER